MRPKVRGNIRGRPAVETLFFHDRSFKAALYRKSSIEPRTLGSPRGAQSLRIVTVSRAQD